MGNQKIIFFHDLHFLRIEEVLQLPLQFAVCYVGSGRIERHTQAFPLASRLRVPPPLSGMTRGCPTVKVGCFERIDNVLRATSTTSRSGRRRQMSEEKSHRPGAQAD